MEKPIIDLRTEQLKEHFDATNAKLIVEWLIAAENRRPVVLVGAGFSRNAMHKYRGDHARRNEVPLWVHLAQQMATHLQVDVGRYDAPTMADMYVASFGDADLRDLLKSMLPDDALAPGRAHRALANYDVAALITTNFLDTLLDAAKYKEDDNWNRVIADADLSASTKTGRSTPDLIYFHGHRCASDTWIMTRSQYEDVATTRPVVVARVRQLMAQHPLLAVGFGLADPNFHNLYRQVSTNMRRHQPLGLSIQLTEVSEPERRHWDELGIRIAVPLHADTIRDDPARSNEFFEWLFKQLSTSWSPSEDAVLDYVLKEPDPGRRLKKFRDLLPHRWEGAEKAGHYEEQADRWTAWRKVLFSFLTDKDREFAKQTSGKIAEASFQRTTDRVTRGIAIAAGENRATPESTRVGNSAQPNDTGIPNFKFLPDDWKVLQKDHAKTWELDAVLGHLRVAGDFLAKYFELALDFDLFRTEDAEQASLPWIPLTFWLATRASDANPERLQILARQCIDSAEKYGDEPWVSLIQTEARIAGFEIGTDANQTSGGVSLAEEAFKAMLDADFEQASKKYQQAADRARGEGRELEEWAWRTGELDALHALLDPYSGGPTVDGDRRQSLEQQKRECTSRVDHLKDTRVVHGWLDRSKDRVHRALEHALEQRESASRYRATGGSGTRFDRSPYMAWRSFRDMEAMRAPPRLQKRYLAPLLWDGGFSIDAELNYRMTFDVKHTFDWIDDLLDRPSASIQAQTERDAMLMESFWTATRTRRTKSEQYGQLIALPGLKHAFRASDVETMRGWLQHAKQNLGAEVRTYASRTLLDGDFSKALRTLAAFGGCAETRELFEEWQKTARGFGRYDLARSFFSFPWFRWALTQPKEVASWLTSFVEGQLRSRSEETSAGPPTARAVNTEDDMFVFAMFKMLEELQSSAPECIDEHLRSNLLTSTSELLLRPIEQDHTWEARRGGYLIEDALLTSGDKRAELVERWSTVDGWSVQDADGRLELQWSIIADALLERGRGSAPQALTECLLALWQDIDGTGKWEGIEAKYTLNPGHAEPLIR
ncbi:MAG TPA: SIR2 family protein, partial [Polyangiaceae bacterium]|nr:SIR2 family protein [Polyangiaceae bacterium]